MKTEEIRGKNIARSKDVALVALVRFEVTLVPSQVLVCLHLFKLCNARDVCGYTACCPSRDKVGRASSLKEKDGILVGVMIKVYLQSEHGCVEVGEVTD